MGQSNATAVSTEPRYVVRLAATPLKSVASSRLPAYHTSICIDGVEVSFNDKGICVDREWASHMRGGALGLNGPAEIREMGLSAHSVGELLQAMRPHFQAGTYDLLRKNCNCFSDCALMYLLGKRLDEGLSSLDRLGGYFESNLRVVLLMMGYKPNPRAALFIKDSTIKHLKSLSEKAAGFRSRSRAGPA